MENTVLVINSGEVEKLLPIQEAVDVVEKAFRSHARDKMRMPPKVYLDLPEFKGDFRAMPAFSSQDKLASIKWVNSHRNNARSGLPSVMATMILNDAKTGAPVAILDATAITGIRTGAAGGVATKTLASRKARRAAFVGAGAQAIYQAQAILEVRPELEEISIHDPSRKAMESFTQFMEKRFNGLIKQYRNVQACVTGADIITTTTPSRKPLILPEWVSPGTHINAIGADAPGKQELDPGILRNGKIIVDEREQAIHSGEVNVPIQKKNIQARRIHGTLGEVLTGAVAGRTTETEITIFDSTGLAIQDLASAAYILNRAKQEGLGQQIAL